MAKKEFKVKINVRIKKMEEEEYRTVAGLWKRMMLEFEEGLRANLRANALDYKTFKELDKGFDFISLASLDVPLGPPISTIKAELKPDLPVQPAAEIERAPVIPEVKHTPRVDSQASGPLKSPEIPPILKQPAVIAETPSHLSLSESSTPEREPPSLRSLTGMTRSPSARPSSPILVEPLVRPSPGIPRVPAVEGPDVKAPIEEEDRATGIAILRQQMLSELKKIRGIIETKE